MNKVVMIGAGKTGRGFLGRLFASDNKEILFVDKNAELVDALNEAGSFNVDFFGNSREPVKVANYTAVTWDNAVLSDSEVIFVSVGGSNLVDVGNQLKTRINDGKMRHIVVCENASHPAKTLREAIGLDNITVSESTVFCTTIENGELDIASENYPYLQCDAAPLGDYTIQIAGIKQIDGFENFLTRKLYTYNAASCVIAYIGYIKGFTDYGEAANDPEILELLDRNYAATNRVLCKVYGYDEADQAEFALLSKKKFCDRTIRDTVSRNAREPQRKLKFAERIMGPLCLLEEYGEDSSVLVMTAAAALHYSDKSDVEWQKIKDSNTPEQILESICGVKSDSEIGKKIMAQYESMKK